MSWYIRGGRGGDNFARWPARLFLNLFTCSSKGQWVNPASRLLAKYLRQVRGIKLAINWPSGYTIPGQSGCGEQWSNGSSFVTVSKIASACLYRCCVNAFFRRLQLIKAADQQDANRTCRTTRTLPNGIWLLRTIVAIRLTSFPPAEHAYLCFLDFPKEYFISIFLSSIALSPFLWTLASATCWWHKCLHGAAAYLPSFRLPLFRRHLCLVSVIISLIIYDYQVTAAANGHWSRILLHWPEVRPCPEGEEVSSGRNLSRRTARHSTHFKRSFIHSLGTCWKKVTLIIAIVLAHYYYRKYRCNLTFMLRHSTKNRHTHKSL